MSSRLQMLEGLVAQGKADAFTHYALALEYKSLQRFDDALEVFQQLRTTHPEYLPSYQMAGQMLAGMGRDKDAREWLIRGIDLAKKAGNAHAAAEMEALLATLTAD